tara:strand:- start:229 stop:462 length:234 start_codon:yes stop_codon:yes gene_type:complete
MLKLKELLNEAPSMRNVTIGDKFISRQRKSEGELEVIDFYVTKNIKGKVVDAKVLAKNNLKVTSLHPFSSVVRGRVK